MTSGDKLAWWERALNLVPGGKGIGTIVKTADELADIVKDINKLNKATDFTEIAKTIEKGGEFSEIRKIPAETLNKELAKIGYKEPTFKEGTEVLSVKLEKDTTFVRVHGDNNTVIPWLLTKGQYNSYIKDGEAGIMRLRSEFSIPESNPITKLTEVNIPSGNKIKIGVASEQFGGKGGGIQYYVENAKKSWFENTIEVGKLIK